MFSETVIDRELVQAFRETEYRVHSEQPFTLRVDGMSPELLGLYRQRRVGSCAFITACNPFSSCVDVAENQARQEELAQELTTRGLAFIGCIGQHPSNNWPGEISFLALGLDLEAAKALGKRFEQNAIVWAGADGVPQLILLR